MSRFSQPVMCSMSVLQEDLWMFNRIAMIIIFINKGANEREHEGADHYVFLSVNFSLPPDPTVPAAPTS